MKHPLSILITAALISTAPISVFGQVSLSINIAPPELPVYEQPPVPGDGYLWTPGYWGYGTGGYYWVPGTWVEPPAVGFLWTPGYWFWREGFYGFHAGYWGPHIGYYGGINYGYGYSGNGYQGGRWDHGQFMYNRSVNNVNVTNIHNTYTENVVNNANVTRVSYNGGGGINARPRAEEQAAEQERHVAVTSKQVSHEQMAAARPEQRYAISQNHPPIAATPRPAEFDRQGVVAARMEQSRPAQEEAHPDVRPQQQHEQGHQQQDRGAQEHEQ